MKRCAIYARYSSDLQSPTSISDQFRVCESFAERQGWPVVARFEDAALSGFGVEHRPGYRALVAAAIQSPPPFDLILVEDVSRLTRDLSEVLRLYHRLRLKGVDLIGISDGVSTVNQTGKITLTVKGPRQRVVPRRPQSQNAPRARRTDCARHERGWPALRLSHGIGTGRSARE